MLNSLKAKFASRKQQIAGAFPAASNSVKTASELCWFVCVCVSLRRTGEFTALDGALNFLSFHFLFKNLAKYSVRYSNDKNFCTD